LATGLAIRACHVPSSAARDRVERRPPPDRCDSACRLHERLEPYPLLAVDQVGYIPGALEVPTAFFQLVSSRSEPASLLVTSNKPFGRWGEVFSDEVAAATLDQLVHQAEVTKLRRRQLPAEGPRPRPPNTPQYQQVTHPRGSNPRRPSSPGTSTRTKRPHDEMQSWVVWGPAFRRRPQARPRLSARNEPLVRICVMELAGR
jgi:hypothetical protein